jgi:hypothetical protein
MIIREYIEENRRALPRSQQGSAPRIVQRMLTRTRWLFSHDFDTLQQVQGAGLNAFVRAALKKPEGTITEEQVALWPDEMREHLQAGSQAALFVPSRGRYVGLVPGHISRTELDEAADYLIARGFETVRRGQAYKRAAARMT